MDGRAHFRKAEQFAEKAAEYLGHGDGQDTASVWAELTSQAPGLARELSRRARLHFRRPGGNGGPRDVSGQAAHPLPR